MKQRWKTNPPTSQSATFAFFGYQAIEFQFFAVTGIPSPLTCIELSCIAWQSLLWPSFASDPWPLTPTLHCIASWACSSKSGSYLFGEFCIENLLLVAVTSSALQIRALNNQTLDSEAFRPFVRRDHSWRKVCLQRFYCPPTEQNSHPYGLFSSEGGPCYTNQYTAVEVFQNSVQ